MTDLNPGPGGTVSPQVNPRPDRDAEAEDGDREPDEHGGRASWKNIPNQDAMRQLFYEDRQGEDRDDREEQEARAGLRALEGGPGQRRGDEPVRPEDKPDDPKGKIENLHPSLPFSCPPPGLK